MTDRHASLDDVRALLEAGLACPYCTAFNRPGVTNIEVALAVLKAFCRCCSKEGPLADFQPEAH